MREIGRILLVEDDPRDVELIREGLADAHVANELDVVEDGAEALDFLFRRGCFAERAPLTPAVVLLDLKLPKVNGHEVLRQIRADAQLRRLPVVILTASREESDLERSYDAGTNAYVVKPLKFLDFIAAIRSLGIFWGLVNEPPPAERAVSDDDRLHMKSRLKRLAPAVRRAVQETRARTERRQVAAALEESEARYQALLDSHQRLASIVATAMDAIITIDGQQRIVLFNAAAEGMFGCPAAEAIGTSIERFIPQALRGSHAEHVERFLAHGSTKRAMGQLMPLAALRADGEEFPIEAAISRVQAGDQQLATVVVRDISARRAAEAALLRSQRQLHLAHQIGRTGSFDWNFARNEMDCSAEIAALYGYPKEPFQGTYEAWHAAVHPADHAVVAERIAAALQSGDYEAEFRVIWPDGSEHWLAGRGAVFRDERGRPDSMLGVNIDITDRKAAEETTRRRAQHDPLTGLPNRALLHEFADHLLPAVRRGHGHAAVLFVDLDRFKPINDTYGHDVGDAVLKEVARRLADSLRGEDLVARLGGDEFVAVLAHIHGEEDAATIAGHVLAHLGKPYLTDGVELNVSPSIGISLFPRDGDAMDELIKHADAAMYAAKAHGRNTFEFYRPAPDARCA